MVETGLYPESMVTLAAMIGFIIGIVFVLLLIFLFELPRRKKIPERDKKIAKKMRELSNSFAELDRLLLTREENKESENENV